MERLLHKVDRLVVGDPMDDATNLGPLISPAPARPRARRSSSARSRPAPRSSAAASFWTAPAPLPADRHHGRRAGLRDRPERGLRPRRLRARLRLRRRGLRARQRHPLRARRLGLDARRLPRPARRARARGRYGLDQRAPRHRLGDAARRGEGFGLRQGHVHVRARGVHGDQARRLRAHRRTRKDWYDAVSTPRTHDAPTPTSTWRPSPSASATSTAVDDLTLSIPRGAFYALLGPSGCGKTTTLRMIGGFEDPTAGRVYLGGDEVTQLRPTSAT